MSKPAPFYHLWLNVGSLGNAGMDVDKLKDNNKIVRGNVISLLKQIKAERSVYPNSMGIAEKSEEEETPDHTGVEEKESKESKW